MQDHYLEITYRKGRPIAAYLYLSRREGDRSARSSEAGKGIVVDFAADDRPIGIEIVSPMTVKPDAINGVLASFGMAPLTSEDLRPLVAA